MSFFQDDIEHLKKAIKFFNSLTNERKAYLVANIITPNAYTKDELAHLRPFLQAIQFDVLSHSELEVAQKIFELGMDETYSKLFVTNVIKQAPTYEYHLNLLSQIDDKLFEQSFSSIINDVYVQLKLREEILTKHNLSQEQFNAIVSSFNLTMTNFLRKTTSEKLIKDKLQSCGFSIVKIDTYLNTLKVNAEFAREMLVFSNIQDTFLSIAELKEQNNVILQTLREILKILRESQSPSKQNPYS